MGLCSSNSTQQTSAVSSTQPLIRRWQSGLLIVLSWREHGPKRQILDYTDVIGKWMARNVLMLDPTKSDFTWCTTPRRVHLIDRSAFRLNEGTVEISSVISGLSSMSQRSRLTMSTDSSGRSYRRRRLKCFRRSLPTSTALQLVNLFVISRVDYCNSIPAGLPKYQLDHIQFILSVAARLMFDRGRHDRYCEIDCTGSGCLNVSSSSAACSSTKR